MQLRPIKKAVILGICMLLLMGCRKKEPEKLAEPTEDTHTMDEVETLGKKTDDLTVWSVYWDCLDDIGVLKKKRDSIGAVSLFAAYFKDGAVMVPEATERMMGKIRRSEKTKDMTVYLSVVNDVEKNGKITHKDTDIVRDAVGTREAADAHAKTLVDLAVQGGYDGIEIDYEKIRSDLDLWDHFLEFEQILLERAGKEDLAVRIILEPSTPVDELSFPDGAEYVVMCYNLYGNGTEPGPKADFSFLKEMVQKFSALPNISYALANGGYDWEGNTKNAEQLRAEEIEQIADAAGVTPERDEDSGALSVTCKTGGKTHTYWYADETTLAQWADWLKEVSESDVKISLWRM